MHQGGKEGENTTFHLLLCVTYMLPIMDFLRDRIREYLILHVYMGDDADTNIVIIDHHRPDVLVTEQFLHRADVIPRFE